MAAIQTRPFENTLLLKMGTSPVAGLLPADVTVKYRKQGQTSFQTKSLDSSNFIEIGNGYYILKWSQSDMDTLGNFYFQIDGLAIDLQEKEFSIETLPQDLVITPPNLCVVSGVIRDASGQPLQNVLISAKALEWPYQNNMSILSDSLVTARTDSQGFFQFSLIRGIKVLIEVERSGIRYQATVPDAASVLINDLITFPAFV